MDILICSLDLVPMKFHIYYMIKNTDYCPKIFAHISDYFPEGIHRCSYIGRKGINILKAFDSSAKSTSMELVLIYSHP